MWKQDWTSHNTFASSTSSILNGECAYTIIMSQNGWKIQLWWISADGLLRHLLELWVISFFFLLSNGICAKTSHCTEVSSLQWVINPLVWKMSNRHSHYFCLVLWKNAHLYTKHFTKAFILGRQGEECVVDFYLGKGLSTFFFCLWPLGLEIKHQLKMDASLWHSSRS